MSKTILITGGAGYVGSHIAKYFLEQGARVIIVDDLSRGFREVTEILTKFGRVDFWEGDIADEKFLDKVFQDKKIDAVIHCAALCVPHESFAQPEEYERVNVFGTKVLLAAMAKHGVTNLTFASTCSVYGDVDNQALTTAYPVKPPHPYAETKLRAEEEIKKFSSKHKIKYLIFRFFNVCGADQEGIIGDGRRPSHLLMPNAVRGALRLDDFYYTCPQVKTPDGTPIRDYINVLDLARAHELALDYLAKGGGSKIINLGSGQGFSVKQIVSQVEQTLGVRLEKRQAVPRLGEPNALFADISEAQTILGWQPQRSLEDSIKSLALWYQNRPRGYKY